MIARRPLLVILTLVMMMTAFAHAGEPVPLRIGALRFGTVMWELDVIKHHKLDEQQGLSLEVVPLAGKQAGAIALKAGQIDAIVSDWIWTSRQRSQGQEYSFIPYSASVGALMADPAANIQDVGNLAGKRLGVAGGPLDKNWLLLRAFAREQGTADIADVTEVVYGAPPLLAEQLLQGRLDAVLTFWHYAARLEAGGMQRVLDVSDVLRGLGYDPGIPQLGYVFRDEWIAAHPGAGVRFLGASRAAKQRLKESDGEWARLKPMMKAKSEAEFVLLREGYLAGTPTGWGKGDMEAAEKLFKLLAKLGGTKLVGSQPKLAAGTFVAGAQY